MHGNAPLTRIAPLLAGVASAAYCLQATLVLRAPQAEEGFALADYVIEATFAVALAASIPAVGRLARGLGRAASAGRLLAAVGFAGMLTSAIATFAAGGETLGPAFVLGLLGALAGTLTLAVVSLRHRAGPWWAAPALAGTLIAALALGDNGGGIVLGLGWVAVAISLWQGTATAPRPATAHLSRS